MASGLPCNDVLYAILKDWLPIADLSILDSALCNEIERANFLSIITMASFFHPTNFQANNKRYLKWLSLREIKIISLTLSTCIPIPTTFLKYLSRMPTLIFDHMTVKMWKCSFFWRIIKQGNNKIKSLDLSDDEDLCDHNVESILELIEGLESLNISGCSNLTNNVSDIIIKLAPNLTHLNIGNCMGMDEHVFIEFAQGLPKLRTFLLSSNTIDDRFVEFVPFLTELRSFYFFGYHFHAGNWSLTNASVLLVAEHCRKLESVYFVRIPVDDSGLIKLANNCPNLTFIELDKDAEGISDKSMLVLAEKCKNLSSLTIPASLITDVGLIALAQNCTNITQLDLQNNNIITDKAIRICAQQWTKLAFINVQNCSKINEIALIYLIFCSNQLTKLTCSSTTSTHIIVNQFFQNRDKIVINSLQNSESITLSHNNDNNITKFETPFEINIKDIISGITIHCPKLTSITINNTDLDDNLLEYLCVHCPLISQLDIRHNSKITTQSLVTVAAHCLHLTSLSVSHFSSLTYENFIEDFLHKCGGQLKTLNLEYCCVDCSDTVRHIGKYCPLLEYLSLAFFEEKDYSGDVGSWDINYIIETCRFLYSLNLEGCRCLEADSILETIADCESIKVLNIKGGVEVDRTACSDFLMNYEMHKFDW